MKFKQSTGGSKQLTLEYIIIIFLGYHNSK